MRRTLPLPLLLPPLPLLAEEPDLTMQTRVRQEAFRNSKIMETAQILFDSIGPRLTGSPNMKRANEWTLKRLEDVGRATAHLASSGAFCRGRADQPCTGHTDTRP